MALSYMPNPGWGLKGAPQMVCDGCSKGCSGGAETGKLVKVLPKEPGTVVHVHE